MGSLLHACIDDRDDTKLSNISSVAPDNIINSKKEISKISQNFEKKLLFFHLMSAANALLRHITSFATSSMHGNARQINKILVIL